MNPIKTYAVTVQGFSACLYSARSPAKARARCYQDYRRYDNSVTFGKFLRISSIRAASTPEGVGKRFIVAGKPATSVIDGGVTGERHRMLFMYDDSDVIVHAHPSEVQAAS